MQRDLISRLREDTGAKDARIRQLESLVAPRPTSRERLPPMDGFPGECYFMSSCCGNQIEFSVVVVWCVRHHASGCRLWTVSQVIAPS